MLFMKLKMTSQILFPSSFVIQSNGIRSKVLALFADNTNCNFGEAVWGGGNNSIFFPQTAKLFRKYFNWCRLCSSHCSQLYQNCCQVSVIWHGSYCWYCWFRHFHIRVRMKNLKKKKVTLNIQSSRDTVTLGGWLHNHL